MVDDALFAILGQRPDAQPSPAPDAQVRPRVVRTSERIGAGARILGLLVLAAAGFGVGLAAAVAPDQAAPEVAAEELKGVASDLERGGLAALRKAEETIAELDRSNPELRPVLAGALAEIHARRFARFGRAPSAREAAREAARAARAGPATVESLYAAALTSTAPAALERLDRGFAAALDVYPESPKAWVGRALVSLRRGEEEAALARLLEARALHPQHRQTLLETARWLARRGASRAALETYARLQSYHGLDVEAAIERFVLDWATGQDPAPDEAVSILAGLVREEIAEVAGDEAGRAALAFALPKLRNARVQEGLTELSKAEGAFAGSPDYQSTVGRVLLALGEAERAQESFLRAAESAPEAARHALDLARARFAEAAGYRFELEELRKRVARLQRDAPLGQVRLPYGTVEARPATFTLVSVELDAGAFPESLLAAALEGDAPRDAALAAAVDGALARRALREGDLERARSRLQAAREHADLPLLAGIEGRLLLARGRPEAAAARLGPPVEAGRGGPVLALALARARAEAEDAIGALDAYARFFARGGLSPEARVEEARLRMTRGDDEGALEALDAAEALESGHAAAALTRAEVLLRQERPEDARAALERAIELEPRIARGIPPRGLDGFSPALLTELGARALPRKRRLGIALLRAALEEPGAPAKVHFHLGAALVKRRATRREGRRELARYLSLAPEGPHRAEAERLSRRR
jgi:predicted Zn-dependent protease